MQSRQKNNGFSLTEMLVVVAIIAILVSILLPTLVGARESANQLVCVSNQSAIITASINYTEDYDDRLPAAELPLRVNGSTPDPLFNFEDHWKSSSRSTHTWADTLYRLEYGVSIGQMACPSDEEENYAPMSDRNRLSYGVNNYLYQQNVSGYYGQFRNMNSSNYADNGNSGNGYYGPLLDEIKTPSRTIWTTDATQFANRRTAFVGWHYPWRIAWPGIHRHYGRIIQSYIDGSVAHENFEDLYGIPYNPELNLYNHFKLSKANGGYGYDDGGSTANINGWNSTYGWTSPVMHYGSFWAATNFNPKKHP